MATIPTEPVAKFCLYQVAYYVEQARTLGYNVTVHNQPQTPLAMGNHTSVVEMRPAHSTYRDKSDTTVTKEST